MKSSGSGKTANKCPVCGGEMTLEEQYDLVTEEVVGEYLLCEDCDFVEYVA